MDATRAIQAAVARADLLICGALAFLRITLPYTIMAALLCIVIKRRHAKKQGRSGVL